MAKVINKTTHLTNMKDGDALIIIGGRSGLCYPKLFTVEDTRRLLTCKVTILPPGSTIML